MRIFISVASPDRPKAEEVALALRGDGHVVFLDDHDLPVAQTYHERIRSAIALADLVIFFISPVSIQPKRYTLSELKFVQDKWPHPKGRLIPVMATPTEMRSIPPYLRAVSICKPRGDLAAEVAYEVSRIAKRSHRLWAPTFFLNTSTSQPTPASRPPHLGFDIVLFLVLGALAGLINVMVHGGRVSNLPLMGSDLMRGAVFTLLVVFALVYYELATLRTLVAAFAATTVAFVVANAIPGGDTALVALRGATRAGILVIGLWAALRELKEPASAGIVIAAGAVGELMMWPPYAVGIWEASVAAALGYVLAGVAGNRQRIRSTTASGTMPGRPSTSGRSPSRI